MIIKENLKEKVNAPDKVADLLNTALEMESPIDQDKEHFWVIGVDCKLRVKYIDLVSLGILDQCIIHPREVFKLAILKGVASVIVGHNHPSGTHNPSIEDIGITKRLIEAGEILGIDVLDHVIISKEGFYSMKEKGDI